MKHQEQSYIFVILLGIFLGAAIWSISNIYAALTSPTDRGNLNITTVDGSLMRVYEKIFVSTGLTSSGKVINAQNLGGSGISSFQNRIVTDPSTCIVASTPIIDIANVGTATCRSTVPAVCGSASGGTFTSKPTTDLCDAGSIASAVIDEGFSPTNTDVGPYTWTCTRGTTVNCAAYSRGVCSPVSVGSCNSGMPTTMLGTIPPPSAQCGPVRTYYWWNCNGSNGANDLCNRCD